MFNLLLETNKQIVFEDSNTYSDSRTYADIQSTWAIANVIMYSREGWDIIGQVLPMGPGENFEIIDGGIISIYDLHCNCVWETFECIL